MLFYSQDKVITQTLLQTTNLMTIAPLKQIINILQSKMERDR